MLNKLNKKQNVSDLYDRYRKGQLSKKALESMLTEQILANPVFFAGCYCPRDDFTDFVAWIYPRLCSAIDRYKDLGASFETFIRVLVRHAYRSFYAKNKEHALTEEVVWIAKAVEGTSAAEKIQVPELEEPVEAFQPVSNPRQVLVLLLKSYHFVALSFVERIAPALGMEAAEIMRMIIELRDMRHKQEQKAHDLRERVYAQHYRCLSFQRRAEAAADGSLRKQHLQDCFIRGTKRLESMRASLKRLNLNAKNEEVANVLGLSKGTIDATLFFTRKHYGIAAGEGRRTPPPPPVDVPPEAEN